MAKSLSRHLTREQEITQKNVIPGRENDMSQNAAGGFSFNVDDWKRLTRFLVMGTEGGSFYAKEEGLTKENAATVSKLIKQDGERVVRTTLEISDQGKALKNTPAIFVLALAFSEGNEATKHAAKAALTKICRTGTHLFQFAEEINNLRGWGRSVRNAISSWYGMPTEGLTYQVLKYQQREGWSHRDVLRLSHIKPKTEDHNKLFNYIVSGVVPEGMNNPLVSAVIEAKTASTKRIIKLIEERNLPRECIPTDKLNDKTIWEALLQKMPMHAMIRNLAKMTNIGLIENGAFATTKMVTDKLTNQEYIRKSRLHPISILIALKTYAQGHGEKGKLSWMPVQLVLDALDAAFYMAFDNVEPTGKRIYLGLDISGSMSGSPAGVSGLRACEVTAAMALITASKEKDYIIRGFGHELVDLNVSPRMRLDTVIREVSNKNFGSTDASLPMKDSIARNLGIDTFCVYTDNESFAGINHPATELANYRRKTGIPARLAAISTTPTNHTIADPNDAGMLDIVGFTPDMPAILAQFIKGEL